MSTERKTCHICYGMGVIERGSAGPIDCPNRSCDNGFIIIKKTGLDNGQSNKQHDESNNKDKIKS
jgi:hypothetical protein